MSFSEWKYISASNFCSKVADGTHDSPKRQNIGKPLITSKHIKGRNIDFESAYLISVEDFNKINQRSIVEQWDVLISMIGEYCGFCYIERNKDVDYAVKNVGIFKAGNKSKAEWIYYYLNSPMGKGTLASLKSGTSQPYISLGSLRDLPLLVPERENVIIGITSILSSIDDKIENNHQTNQTLEEIARTIFKEWFVNFNYPNTDGRKKHSEFGEIPADWKIGKLGNIADQVKTTVNPSLYPQKQFNHYSLPAFDIDELPSLDLGETILSNKTNVKKYSVLISKLNPRIPRIWSIGDIDESVSICSTEFIGFTPKKASYYSFINYFFKQPELVNRLTGIATGTSNSHQRIKPTDLLDLEFPLPNEILIKQFDKIVKPILEKRFQNIQENQTLKSLRDSLLPKLMRGEIKV